MGAMVDRGKLGKGLRRLALALLPAIAAAYLALAVPALAGCNTVRGVGQDIEKGGEAIQKAVK